MKKFIVFIILLFNFVSFSQVSVSRSHHGPFKDLKKEDYKLIKSKKTVFVLDDFTTEEFEKMISSFWNLNKFIVVTRSEYEKNWEKYITDEYAIFEFGGKVITTTSSSGMSSEYLYLNYTYFYYSDIKIKKDKTKFDTNEVASVFFAGNAPAMWNMIRTLKYNNLQKDLFNYKLGFMKNYLQFINKNLNDEWYSFSYASEYDKKDLKVLKNATLYIPDYIRTKYNALNGTETDRGDSDELFKKYNYKYEFIDTNMLNEKILNTKEDFYYLMYTKINSQKFVSVVNGKTGKIIYRDYDTLSYNIKAKDIGQLNNTIK